ncbi:MAG: hypoxanthine phosphoribosyltransferase [Acholeplasma sp.]|nr:hypoxanthine phosphoribosyltransferase [Acholeplasma sp.]
MHEIMEEILLSEEDIIKACKSMGKQITADYQDGDLVLIGLLKGCNPFLSDLAKQIDLPLEIQYMIVSSYHGGTTSTEIQIKYDLEIPIANRDILIVEDIVDTGQTIEAVVSLLKSRGARSIKVATLLDKTANNNLNPDYVGYNIPNKFVLGYGLDFQEKYRNLPYIGVLKKEYYDK